LEINGRSTLDYVFDSLRAAEIKRVCLVTHHLFEKIDSWAARYAQQDGLEIRCVRQDGLRGTADAVNTAMMSCGEWFGEEFLLSATDYLVAKAFYSELLDFHTQHVADISVSLKSLSAEDMATRSSVRFGQNNEVLEIVEKPPLGAAPSSFGANLVFVLPTQIHTYVRNVSDSARGELEIQSAINAYLSNGGTARGLTQATPDEWHAPVG
jgi:dTDP-glucose pyrophosphorylase